MSRAIPKDIKQRGLDYFAETARKRQNPLRVARDLSNGRFAAPEGTSNEPDHVYHFVHVLEDLKGLQEPLEILLQVLVAQAQEDPQDEAAAGMAFLASHVQAFHKVWAEIYRAWLVDGGDSWALKEALKPPMKPAFARDPEARLLAAKAMLERARVRGLLERPAPVAQEVSEGGEQS